MNIADVKKELSSDEKVLESAFKLETLYKKHKVKIWAVLTALVVFFGGKALQESLHASALAKANEAFLTLQKNANDTQARKVLAENNPELMALFSYAQAVKNKDVKALESLTGSQNRLLSDVSSYTVGVLTKKPVESVLYKELSLFEQAYAALKEGDKKMAKLKLELIDERSPLAVVTRFFKHSLIKAK